MGSSPPKRNTKKQTDQAEDTKETKTQKNRNATQKYWGGF